MDNFWITFDNLLIVLIFVSIFASSPSFVFCKESFCHTKKPVTRITIVANTKIDTFSKLLLFPKTGRTHQIRVHLVSLNTPIVGDPLYSRKHNKFPRMFLLAKSIVFNHPKNNKLMNFSIEEPYEFHKFWNSL